MEKIFEVYDLECLSNLFTYTGYDVVKKEYYQYVIHRDRNDYKELYEHLWNNKENMIQIGFNSESYDYPLEHHLLNHWDEYQYYDGQKLACKLYEKSQAIIEMEYSAIADKNKFIIQLDLFRIFHYNNPARATSLKDLEIALRLENVEEMPLHHTHWCYKEHIPMILEYNKNDVYSTYEFFKIALGKTDNPIYKGDNVIDLRIKLNKKFNLPCLNYPDVKIGEQLMLKLYCLKTGVSPKYLKNLGGTPRDKIILKNCIPHWVKFESKEFNKLKSEIENTTILNTKGEFKKSVIFHGTQIDYGTGGAHSCIKPGVYKEDDYWMILDSDIGSLYPSLGVTLNLYPEHLGPEFAQIYDEDIVSVRLAEKKKPKKERDNVIMKGYKLAANGIYGKSNEETSFLYDPVYTMKITLAGQMFLSMWTEKLVKAIPEIKFLQHNTDGITYLLPRKDYDKAIEVNAEMTRITGLYIEDNLYSAMIIRDCNNYIAVYNDSTLEHEHLKLKGCFEIDKELYKDPSMRIVPIALKNYFVHGIPIGKTVRNHNDILDFCLRLKCNSKSTGYYSFTDKDLVKHVEKLHRTTRYYISKTGGYLYKDLNNGRSLTDVNSGYVATIFNRLIEKPISEYNLNYNFYISEANKIKDAIEIDKQLTFNF